MNYCKKKCSKETTVESKYDLILRIKPIVDLILRMKLK